MRFWTAAYSIARLRGGRTSTYNSSLLYGSGDKLMGESSYVKSWLDAHLKRESVPFHVKSSMHDRAVTANVGNDRKARNEPSDVGKDYRKWI